MSAVATELQSGWRIVSDMDPELCPAAAEGLATSRDAFVLAIRRRDALAACAVYAADAYLLPPAAEPVRGRDEICSFWRAGLDTGIADIALDASMVGDHDGVAFEIGRYTLRLEPTDAVPFVERGNYVHVHQRQPDGSWQRAVDMFSPGGAQ